MGGRNDRSRLLSRMVSGRLRTWIMDVAGRGKEVKPKTPLGKRLLRIRKRGIKNGMKLLSRKEIEERLEGYKEEVKGEKK